MKHIPVLSLACLLAVGGCKPPSELPPEKEEAPLAQPQPAPEHERKSIGNLDTGPKMKTGGCTNEHLQGTCSFLSLHAEKPADSTPTGKTYYRVMYSVEADGKKVELDRFCLGIPSDREKDLRDHLESHSPIACTAYIVRPPCNPQATSVTPKIDLPDWVTKERCY